MPGLTATFDVPANSFVLLMTDGGIVVDGASPTGFAIVDVAFSVNGQDPAGDPVPAGLRRLFASNTASTTSVITNWSFSRIQPLAAGTHTVTVMARQIGGNANSVVSGNGLSVLQGQLTIVIVTP